MIVVNFKTYAQSTGTAAVRLAKICKKVSDETKVRVVCAVQNVDLRVCVETGAECWVQHIDAVEPGRHTGFTLLEDVLSGGAVGTLLNHSEHKLEWEILKQTLVRLDNKLEVCVCSQDVVESQKIATLRPKYVAYEPPELIASRDVSVASEKGEVIKQVVEVLGGTPVLVGAGVHSGSDVKVSLGYGAVGVLVATDVVLAEDPEKELRELAEAFI